MRIMKKFRFGKIAVIAMIIVCAFFVEAISVSAANGRSCIYDLGWGRQDIYFNENQCRILADSYGQSADVFATAGGIGSSVMATRVVRRDASGLVKNLGSKANLMTWAFTIGCGFDSYVLRQLEKQYRLGSYGRGCIARCFLGVPFAVDLQ